jgi:hypothetical protein
MSHPREPFERLLDVFDDAFKRIGEREGFAFDPGVGHVRRAIRSNYPSLRRGVFLEFKEHWIKSDPVDPVLVLAYGAWSQAPGGLPVLFKVFYEGNRSGLIGCIDEKLQIAASEVKLVSEETILQYGKTKEDYLREAREGGR